MSNWANQENEREKIQITTTKNEGGAITTNPTDFKRIKEYYDNSMPTNLENYMN